MQTSSSISVPFDARTSEYDAQPRSRARRWAALGLVAMLFSAATVGAVVLRAPDTPSSATGTLSLSNLAGALRQTEAKTSSNCDKDASYLANRVVYNNLGLASVLAGYSTNTVQWGFDHTTCLPVDEACFTFNNVDCRYDGCSWFQSTEFSCKSLLHGHTYLFKDVQKHCEVWAGIDSTPKITCSREGLSAIDPEPAQPAASAPVP